MKKIVLICGGPGSERGISLNSTRCVYDSLDKSKYDITILYINPTLEWFSIPEKLVYSNTPLDFDYYLHNESNQLQKSQVITLLKEQDIVFPIIHGLYGEDGQLQEFLKAHDISFLGSGSNACHVTSNKYLCQEALSKAGFATFKQYLYVKGDTAPDIFNGEKWVIKPLNGGSSIGVCFFTTREEFEH